MPAPIIIPSFNTKELTVPLVTSLLRDKRKCIIIDNGSSDGSKKSLQPFKTNSNFSLIDNPKNLGFTKAINQGIKLALEKYPKADYVIAMNSDIEVLQSNFVEIICDVLKTNTEFGCLLFHDAVIGKNKEKRIIWKDKKIGTTGEGMWYCVAIPRKTIDTVGYLDERFFLHCSDSDYCRRIRLSGQKIGILKNESYIKHKKFKSSRKLPNVHKIIKRDREAYLEKLNSGGYTSEREDFMSMLMKPRKKIKKDVKPILYTNPNKFAPKPSMIILEEGKKVEVTGYDNYILTKTSVIPAKPFGSLPKKYELLKPYFRPETIIGKSFLDLGASTGFFSILASLANANHVSSVDIDKGQLDILKQSCDYVGLNNIHPHVKNVEKWTEPHDYVCALALIHWIYSCTSLLGSLDRVIHFIRMLTDKVLFIEWIDPTDSSVTSFKHLEYNKDFREQPYDRTKFLEALDKYFTKYESIGHTRGDKRELFMASV